MTAADLHVAIAYKNFAANRGISHIGLGVAALNTAKCLRAAGIRAEVWPVVSMAEIEARLHEKVTHVIVSAPWIPIPEWGVLARWPFTNFAVNCHSNVGFLQADRRGMELLQDYANLEQGTLNFHLSANSAKGAGWMRDAYCCPCQYLPNLYYLDGSENPRVPRWSGGILRMGAFGAQRPLKNLMSAAGAAIAIANSLRADSELWLSGGRAEGGGQTVVEAVGAMLSRAPHITLKQQNWQSWPEFRDTVRKMHLLINASYTESFCMVAADGIAEGVPSVTSDAIDWVPDHWQAPVDDVASIARTGRYLLTDPLAAEEGLAALKKHNEDGLRAWKTYLKIA